MTGVEGSEPFRTRPWITPIRPPDLPLLAEETKCLPFLEPQARSDYLTYVAAATRGRVTPMINGRDSNGTARDRMVAEAFDAMQRSVAATAKGDFVYLAGWMFNPDVPLTLGPSRGAKTWGELLRACAAAGVRVCLLLNEFDARTPFRKEIRGYIAALDKLIDAMAATDRPMLQYQVTKHPVIFGGLSFIGITGIIGSHHQKFMVVRREDATTAFCGGLDICTLRTPHWWNGPGLLAWHDIHLQLEGQITRDLEFEFVSRWNREQGQTDIPPRRDWGGLVQLKQTAETRTDQLPERNLQRVQMQRTVSVNNQGKIKPPQLTKRDDIWQGYLKIIGCAKRFLYMENQYFREFLLADHIAARAREAKDLKVIIVVPASLDEGSDPITEHGNGMQYRFFERLFAGLGAARVRVYSMTLRFIHSKLILADDELMSVGSANANRRGFRLDTELNVALADAEAVGAFRRRLWSHNLSVPAADIARWKDDEFFARWDAVAQANAAIVKGKAGAALAAAAGTAAGECVVPFDHHTNPGKYQLLFPDDIADLGNWAAGDERVA